MDAEPDIPWERIAAFVRQFTHEVRNGLNSLDLEISLLRELTTDPESEACAARSREQVRKLANQLRTLSALFQSPQPMKARIAARELLQVWREQHAALAKSLAIRWVDELEEAEVSVDEAMMASVFRELLLNAATFAPAGPLIITGRRTENAVVFEVCEPKAQSADPSDWDEAFFTTRRTGYGLGLCVARRLLEANNATITRHFLKKESALVTNVSVPIAAA
jgi:signal transduction histidine kinase